MPHMQNAMVFEELHVVGMIFFSGQSQREWPWQVWKKKNQESEKV